LYSYLHRCLLWSLLLCSTVSQAQVAGRYVGVLQNEILQRDQHAKLDLIYDQSDRKQQTFRAILTLHFDGFAGPEYISYNFSKVTLNPLKNQLTFAQSNQEISLASAQFNDGRLIATFNSASAGQVGTLILKKDGVVTPTAPQLVPSVWGTYTGQCGGKPRSMHLTTTRAMHDSSQLGNPFVSYEIRGQVGFKSTVAGCSDSKTEQCIKDFINEGSYDFLLGQLRLVGKKRNYDCQLTAQGLNCDDCSFKKVGNQVANIQNSPPWSPNFFTQKSKLPQVLPNGPLAGEYSGFIHHEFLGRYQQLDLTLNSFFDPNDPETFQLDVTARSFFGDRKRSKFLTYKFKTLPFDFLSRSFLLENPEAGIEPILQIKRFDGGLIKGVWYSKHFGRVGEFLVSKNPWPTQTAALPLIQSPQGFFHSEQLELKLDFQNTGISEGAFNPFSPMNFNGYFYYHSGVAARIPIVEGSYDFYTGHIALQTDRTQQIAMGTYDHDTNTLQMHWPYRVIFADFPQWQSEHFEPKGGL
jgi:hypothetical protein